jgi:hypothetical protein
LTLIVFFKYGEPVVLFPLILILFKNLEPTVIRKIKDLRYKKKKSLKFGNYGSLCSFSTKILCMIALDFFLGANWQNLAIVKRKLMVQQAGFFFPFLLFGGFRV